MDVNGAIGTKEGNHVKIMSKELKSKADEKSTLDSIVEFEKELDQRVEECKAAAEERINQTRALIKDRIAREREKIVHEVRQQLEIRKRRLDKALARKMEEKDKGITQIVSELQPLQQELYDQILSDLLGT